MTSSEESARQIRSRRSTCSAIKLAQYPKPLYLKSRACIYKLEPARARTIIQKELNLMKSSIIIAAALGIDIAKAKFDVCLLKENGRAKHKVFLNTRHGFEQLIRWLDSHQVGDHSRA